ncbi:hypothetical protein BDQ17DRAFT_1427564 [Cyathus striatus]|nr:hypothetical protein BDQ17DRAFT_1427564 [Cyathus striatus]
MALNKDGIAHNVWEARHSLDELDHMGYFYDRTLLWGMARKPFIADPLVQNYEHPSSTFKTYAQHITKQLSQQSRNHTTSKWMALERDNFLSLLCGNVHCPAIEKGNIITSNYLSDYCHGVSATEAAHILPEGPLDMADGEWSVESITSHTGSKKDTVFEVNWKVGDVMWLPYSQVSHLDALTAYLNLLGASHISVLPKGNGIPPKDDPQIYVEDTDSPSDHEDGQFLGAVSFIPKHVKNPGISTLNLGLSIFFSALVSFLHSSLHVFVAFAFHIYDALDSSRWPFISKP